ncbi:SusD/RagB family nutrient-binding outer membrane lipoprotein [Parafilimonas sp.]|uniref:SusD/RagB family nutrient-binding outer membrane lipoprotein n=1 Tax=Parafilimonas sp. TaxID=1969739 RepID=UPI0039E7298F
MKKILSILFVSVLVFSACTKKQFEDTYADPSKVSGTTVDRQFAGVLYSNTSYVMYKYYQYFAVYQNTLIPWTQTAATLNDNGRYIPGAAAISDYWDSYYALLAQYKELLRVNAALSEEEQQANRIYIIAATIYFYDFTQKTVDIWGDIPWSGAGLLGTLSGDYQSATTSAKYDDAATIYTTMLDSLKGFADELSTISVPSSVSPGLETQDFINHGDITKWQQYCNSLRIRMLTRVSGVSAFQSRVKSEIADIVGNPSTYPIVTTNDDNIMVAVVSTSTSINNGTDVGNAADFYEGLIGWGYADRAGKVMIDFMNENADPRERAMFEPGDSANGVYRGLDPSLTSTEQTAILDSAVIARYNRSTLSQNIYLPGTLITAAETELSLSEYYLNQGSDAAAKIAYEAGVTQSINFYFYLRTLSDNSVSGDLDSLATGEISNYLAKSGIAWSSAATTAEKLNLIATQKWINSSVMRPMETWAEYRRLDLPTLTFTADVGTQTLPPYRWLYPTDEQTYNTENYSAVEANDDLDTKIFWDVN